MLGMYLQSVKYYHYRQATVEDRFFSVKFEHNDSIDMLRLELAQKAGVSPDNHECYEVTSRNGKILFVQFSDWTMYFGSRLHIN